jgi:hypothetical protein
VVGGKGFQTFSLQAYNIHQKIFGWMIFLWENIIFIEPCLYISPRDHEKILWWGRWVSNFFTTSPQDFWMDDFSIGKYYFY